MTLVDRVDSIRSRADLVGFIKALSEDLHKNRDSWENHDLDRFLSALGAWVDDMDGFYANQRKAIPQTPDWRVVAEMLMGARTYE